MSQLFPGSPALNNFCQSPHFSHPSGHRSLEKVRRGVGDFNLVSTSSNLKGRAGGVREEGRHYRPEPESGEIPSENPEHNDSERDREGGRETNRETGNYVPLDWARCEGAGRVT